MHSSSKNRNQNFPPQNTGSWSSGLFDCFSDGSSCCLTFWCPCITFGRIAEIVDGGTISCAASGAMYCLIGLIFGYPCIYSTKYRSKLRKLYGLPTSACGDCLGDCLLHCFCEKCALCQEYRELQTRGFDMTKGWQWNMEKQNSGVTMAPAVQGGMDR